MPDPTNYSIDVGSPFQAAMQGYSAGTAIYDDTQAQVAKQQQATQQKQQQEQQQRVIGSLIRNPSASADDYANAMLLVPSMKDAIDKAWATKNPAQQQAAVSDLTQVAAAIQSGKPEIAVDMLNQRAEALEKATGGATPQSQALRLKANMTKTDPDFGLWQINSMLAGTEEGRKAISATAQLGAERRASAAAPVDLSIKKSEATIKATEAATAPEKTRIDIANTRSQIETRAKQLSLDQDKLTTETQLKLKEMGLTHGQLPPKIAEEVGTAVTDSISAEQSSSRMYDLAGRIEKEGLISGATAKGNELLKKLTGNQNEVTRLRAEYARIVTPAAMAAYKKVASGSTSDKDIDTAMVGVPSDTADPATMASFLRGAAKLQVYDSVMNNAKSEWLGAVRSLGKAPTDIEVDGVKVPAGQTFKAFVDQYVGPKVAERIGAQTVSTRGYMRYAKPAGATGTY